MLGLPGHFHEDVDERLSLIEPHTIMPQQFFATASRRQRRSGELRLMIAVLQAAIDEFSENRDTRSPRRRRLFHKAAQWLSSESRRHPFAFANICDLLDLDRRTIRRRLGLGAALGDPGRDRIPVREPASLRTLAVG